MVDQITTAAKECLKSKLGTISNSEMQEKEKISRLDKSSKRLVYFQSHDLD